MKITRFWVLLLGCMLLAHLGACDFRQVQPDEGREDEGDGVPRGYRIVGATVYSDEYRVDEIGEYVFDYADTADLTPTLIVRLDLDENTLWEQQAELSEGGFAAHIETFEDDQLAWQRDAVFDEEQGVILNYEYYFPLGDPVLESMYLSQTGSLEYDGAGRETITSLTTYKRSYEDTDNDSVVDEWSTYLASEVSYRNIVTEHTLKPNGGWNWVEAGNYYDQLGSIITVWDCQYRDDGLPESCAVQYPDGEETWGYTASYATERDGVGRLHSITTNWQDSIVDFQQSRTLFAYSADNLLAGVEEQRPHQETWQTDQRMSLAWHPHPLDDSQGALVEWAYRDGSGQLTARYATLDWANSQLVRTVFNIQNEVSEVWELELQEVTDPRGRMMLPPLDSVPEVDADGDGVTVNDGDCDDDDPLVFPGAEEQCNGRDNDCNGYIDGGAYFSGLECVGAVWLETEDPNDCEIDPDTYSVETPPFAEGHFQELGDASGRWLTNELNGSISSIVQDSWGGDNDAYHVTFPQAGILFVTLSWDDGGEDYDTLFYCWYSDPATDPAYYSIPFTPGLADSSNPETGMSSVPLPDGSDCYIVVVGYSGDPAAYSMEITPQGNN